MAKGGCWKIGTFPILEWGEAGLRCQQLRNQRKRIEEASDIAKKEIEEASDVAKTQARSQEDAFQTWARNFGTGTTPGEGVAQSISEGLVGLVPAVLGLATGGLSAIPGALGDTLGGLGNALGVPDESDGSVDLLPVALAVGAGVVLLMVVTSDGRK